jgi:ribonuclease P protein component
LKRFGLSKIERVKNRKDFQKIYNKGRILYSSQKRLKVNYFIESSLNQVGIKAAFVVSSKAGKAVWRNRVKRLLREAYRHNKLELNKLCESKNLQLLVSFSPNNLNEAKKKKINLDDILNDFVDLLEKLKSKVNDA